MTRLTLKAVVSFAIFASVAVHAQLKYVPPPPFKHIVIIAQENRTPDDLFGPAGGGLLGCGGEDAFEPGVDLQNGGPNLVSKQHGGPYITCMTEVADLNSGGAWHGHDWKKPNGVEVGWVSQCDMGADGMCQMDGACHSDQYPDCPEYYYVKKSVVQPYFDIATNYGWANYMFQSNQGPSFEAHQFLFGGTSAPVWPGDPHQLDAYFVAETP